MKNTLRLATTIVFILLQHLVSAQYNECDEKMELLGIHLNQPPDYSQLEYYKTNKMSYAGELVSVFNTYKIINKKVFTGNGYTLSEGYVFVMDGVVSDILLIPQSQKEVDLIVADLNKSSIYPNNNNYYLGKNTQISCANRMEGNMLPSMSFVPRNSSNPVPELTDTSGVIALLGKSMTDPDVIKFMSLIPGKPKQKKGYENYVFDEGGIIMSYDVVGKETKLKRIEYNFSIEDYANTWKLKKTCPGTVPMPYGLTAETPLTQLIDKFGMADDSMKNENVLSYFEKYSIYMVVYPSGQPYDKVKMNSFQIQKY